MKGSRSCKFAMGAPYSRNEAALESQLFGWTFWLEGFGGSPLLQQGELDFSPESREKSAATKMGFSPGNPTE